MYDDRDPSHPGSPNHRTGYKTSLAENNAGLQPAEQCVCLKKSRYDSENICKVFYVKVPAKLARADFIIRYPLFKNQFLLDPIARAYVTNTEAFPFQIRLQCDIGRHMSGRAASCQDYNLFFIHSTQSDPPFFRKASISCPAGSWNDLSPKWGS